MNKIMATTEGRDKAVRAFQFAMRFLTWYLPRYGYDATFALHIEAYILDARRLFRILKEFDAFEKIQNLIKSRAEGRQILKVLGCMQQMGLCGLYLSNHALLAAKLRIVSYDHAVFRKIYGYCFSVSLLAGMLQDLARLYLVRKLRQTMHMRPRIATQECSAKAPVGEALAQLARFRLEITVNLLRNLLDQVLAEAISLQINIFNGPLFLWRHSIHSPACPRQSCNYVKTISAPRSALCRRIDAAREASVDSAFQDSFLPCPFRCPRAFRWMDGSTARARKPGAMQPRPLVKHFDPGQRSKVWSKFLTVAQNFRPLSNVLTPAVRGARIHSGHS